jgi:starch-binding outer membrane protein, SusD/RagB family
MKKLLNIILVSCLMLSVSCIDDLNQTPQLQTTSATVYATASNYKMVLAKLYALYVTAGQEKGGANKDLTSNMGYDYMRCYFNLQEAGTEELASTWIEGDKIADLTYLTWDASDPWVADMYYRLFYTVAVCNEFLRNAADDKISGFTESEQNDIRTFRAEARFLRSLAYYHAMDLYHNIPFVVENDPVGAYIPPRYTSKQIFDFIESELKDIEGTMLDKASCEYGRAPKAAAWALLAKMYLNAEVYEAGPHYTECITYCKKIIDNGYSLESSYAKLFNADNHLRTNEIILPLIVDADHIMSWGATTYLVCGEVSSTKDDSNYKPSDYGVTNGWGMFRIRGEIPVLFAEGDTRAMFFKDGQTLKVDDVTNQLNGYLVTKWTNLTDAGEQASITTADGVDTDYPMFRLGDVYLMLAEAVVRGGTGSTSEEALGYVNALRKRAFGDAYETSGKVSISDLTANFMLDERARELYWECTRRTDLIRFGKFTGDSYIWQWKGGLKDGISVDSKYNIYPIPSSELSANPNLKNENY